MADNTGNNRRKPSFLIIYAAGLLTIALVLVILSYFQQKRANEQLGNLQEQHDSFSVSALQSIDEMRETLVELEARNKALETELSDAKNENIALNSEKQKLETEINSLKTEISDLEKKNKALEDELNELKTSPETDENDTTEE